MGGKKERQANDMSKNGKRKKCSTAAKSKSSLQTRRTYSMKVKSVVVGSMARGRGRLDALERRITQCEVAGWSYKSE